MIVPSSPHPAPLLLLGFGDAGRAVLREVRGQRRPLATTRNEANAAAIAAAGATPLVAPRLTAERLEPLVDGAHVVVTFPPDGETDARVAPALGRAARVVYVSSTGVYGAARGRIDDRTPVDPDAPRAGPRLAAERLYRDAGAIVLRAPGLYAEHTGLHVRLRDGSYRIPGDGQGVISRLHLEDLAQFVLGALSRGEPGEAYVVGDLAPVPQIEVVRFLCERMDLPLPPSAPLSEVSPTLRGSRAVDPSRALSELHVTLRYPSYREGFAACLEGTPQRPASTPDLSP